MEYATPVWNVGLTKAHVGKLESIQKRALKIILGSEYSGYELALTKCSLVSLQSRRRDLCLDFAAKLKSSNTFHKWLPQPRHSQVQYQLRNASNLSTLACKTKRYQNSPIPYFVSLLNHGLYFWGFICHNSAIFSLCLLLLSFLDRCFVLFLDVMYVL